MKWSLLAGAGASTCLALAVCVVLLAGLVFLVRRARRSGPDALPDGPDPAFDLRALREVPAGDARRELLLRRIEPALGTLGDDLQVVKGSKGDLRLRGALSGQPTAVDIDADGRFTALQVEATFPPGVLVLHARHAPDDPDGLLILLDAIEVELLIEQLSEAKLASIRFASDGVVGTSEARLHELDASEETAVVGQTLSALENAVDLWRDRDVLEPPAAPPSLAPPPPPPLPSAPPSDPVKAALSWKNHANDGELAKGAALLFSAIEDLLTKPKQLMPDDERSEAELRGRVNDVPVRFLLESDGEWQLEAKIARVDGSFYVRYDPDLTPKGGDPDDDWADQDDIRVFVAKGMYVEASPDVVEIFMHFAERMTDDQIQRLRDGMANLPLRFVWFLSDELEVGGKVPVQQLEDPVATFRTILAFVGWMGSDIPGGVAGAGSFAQTTCTYCSSRYFHGVRREACPNCGASPAG